MSAGANASSAAVPLMLTELRLPTIKRLWAEVAAQSNREGWPAERLLHTLLGHEMAERETRRLARARVDSQLPPGKSLADFDFAAVPAVSKAHVMALSWCTTPCWTCCTGRSSTSSNRFRLTHA